MADIVEVIPNLEQEKELILTQNKKSSGYIWASDKEILSLGIKKGTKRMNENITDHSFKILPRTKLSALPNHKKNLIINIKM